MDYTAVNYVKLFDALMDVLNRHQDQPGAVEAMEYLKVAKVNYVHHDIDRLMSGIVLAVERMLRRDLSGAIEDDLRACLKEFVGFFSHAADHMRNLAREYETSGGRPLSREEILQEVSTRRGSGE